MEDIFKFLLVIGILVIGFVRQAKKEAKKKAGNPSAMPMPDGKSPFPGDWEDATYGGYIPEGPEPEPIAVTGQTKKKTRPAAASSSPSPSPAPVPQATDEPSEFEIRSVEEARRAIVWSEILQRKY